MPCTMRYPTVLYVERRGADGCIYGDEIQLPTRYVVCPRCEGRGTHDAWDGGITAEQMEEWVDEEREDYFRGVYDVRCTECGGERVIEEVDTARLSPAMLAAYEEQCHDEWAYQAEVEAERRMGA